jgi:hypothetical protein
MGRGGALYPNAFFIGHPFVSFARVTVTSQSVLFNQTDTDFKSMPHHFFLYSRKNFLTVHGLSV